METKLGPGVPRTYKKATDMASDINLKLARPSYSVAAGGTSTIASGTGDTRDTRALFPTRMRFETAGPVKLRYRVGTSDVTGDTLYYDNIVTGYAGELIEVGEPHFVIVADTNCDINLFWPVF